MDQKVKSTLLSRNVVKNSLAVFVVLLVSVLGIKLLMASQAATGGTLSLTSSAASVTPGSTVSVTIREDSGTDTVNAVQASLNYDAAQLQYVGMTEGTAFPQSAATSTGTAGVVRVGRSTSTPVTGSNAVVTVNFKVLASSGTIALSFDKNYSFIVSNTTNNDILALVTGTSIGITGGSAGAASMSLNPGSGTAQAGSTFTVTVRENSGTTNVNSVQASVGYDPAKLQYVSMTEGGTFTNSAATDTGTAGRVRVARSVQTGSVGVTGDNPIVTLSFKVLATSGTAAITLDKTQSFVAASSNNADVLGTVAGSSFTITSPSSGGAATLSLTPASGSYAVNSTIAVDVKVASPSAALMTVQANLVYPAAQLEYVSTTNGTAFPNAQRTNTATAGVVDIIRGVSGGNAGVVGTNSIVTVTFRVKAAGTATISYGATSSAFDDSGTGANVLNSGASTGASYTLTSGTATPTPSPTPAPGSYDLVVTDLTWSPASPATGNQVTFTATIKNTGSVATPASTHRVGFKVDGTTVNWSNNSAASLAPGASRMLTANTGATGSSFWTATTGTHSIVAQVDDTNTLTAEANESNNTLTQSMTVTNPLPTGSASFSMSPNSGSFAQNSIISVQINATSSTAKLLTVQPTISYPAAQLQYQSVTEGSVFTAAQRTNSATPGILDIIRLIPGGTAGVTGTNPVITVNFKVIGTSGAAPVTFSSTSAAYDDSATGTNILNLAGSTTANYTVTTPAPSCTANPSVPGTPARQSSTYTTVTIAWTASTAGSGCAMAGYHVYKDGVLAGDVTSGASYTVSGLLAGETHSYTVSAFDTAGHTSAVSSAAAISSTVDNMAPTTPVGFTAAAPDAVSVNLAWNPSTDFPNPGGVGVQGYRVYRNGASTPTYTVASGTTFKDTNVTANTTYTYVVAAYDKVGNESSPSNIVSAKTATGSVTCTGNPSAPSGLVAGTSTLTTTSMAWSASIPATGCTLAGYRVYRNATLASTTTALNFQDTGLTTDTSYTYTVVAYDTNGHSSAASAGKIIATLADTTAPTAPSNVTAAAVSAGQVTIGWAGASDNVAVTGYKIYRGGTLVTTTGPTVRSYNDTQVAANTNYTYTVSAVDAEGNESTKATATPNPIKTPTASDTSAPTAPASVRTTTIGTNSLALTWNASTDNVAVSGYHVYRAGIYIGDSIGLAFSDTGLIPNTSYVYTVKAFDASGNASAASSNLTVKTLAQVACIVGDLNCDKVVDVFDLSIIMTHWKEVSVPVKFGDIDQDGKVDVFDLSTLLSHLGDRG